MPDLAQYMADVGQRLTGRRLVVEMRPPKVKGARGEFSRRGDVGYILIDPDRSDFILLDTFCHECAHAKLHFYDVPSSTRQELAMRSQSIEVLDHQRPAGYFEREDEAVRLGDYWLNVATRQRILGYSLLDSGLMALSRYADV